MECYVAGHLCTAAPGGSRHFGAFTGTEMCFDFSVSTVLYNLDWTHDIWIIDTMQTIFNTGISHCKCEGQTENDGVIILILEK